MKALILAAICTAGTLYFGYYTVFGPRGLVALASTQARLASNRRQLDALTAARERLQHRIALLRPGHVDPDLVEEIARDQLIGSEPGEIAIPRKPH